MRTEPWRPVSGAIRRLAIDTPGYSSPGVSRFFWDHWPIAPMFLKSSSTQGEDWTNTTFPPAIPTASMQGHPPTITRERRQRPPFGMPTRFWDSLMVRWAEPEKIEEAVRSFAQDLRARFSSVRRILWYGSWVSGVPSPSSDVDLCVILEADERRPRDRVPEFLPARFPVGVDLMVLTEEEFRELEARSPSWHRAIMAGRAM